MPSSTITGTEGDDILVGVEQSDDTIEGLGGNDIIIEESSAGFDQLNGGEGNDLIHARNHINGGVGIDAGAGNDRIEAWLIPSQNSGYTSITTGAGADVLSLDGRFIVTDFTAGDGGDRIDWTPVLARLVGWDQASNPFAGGQRVQVIDTPGAAVIQYSTNGNAGWQDFVYLQGVTAAQLTAFNLSGLTLNGAAPTNLVLTGTAAGETLQGFAGNDTIDGLAGNDIIYGGIGNDTIHGGDDDDIIYGELGSDTLFGDAGNDTIVDYYGATGSMDGGSGNDTLTSVTGGAAPPVLVNPYSFTRTVTGGDGDDLITVAVVANTQVTVDGGNDDDEIHFLGSSSNSANILATITGGGGNDLIDVNGIATVDAGSGNDLVIIGAGAPTVTLGTGVDTVQLNPAFLPSAAHITDFQTGNGGDVVDLLTLLNVNAVGWDYSGTPLLLSQVGANVEMRLNRVSNPVLLVFENHTIAQFTTANFGGFTWNGTEPPGSVVNGTPDDDVLVGTIGDDTIDGLGGNDIITGGFNDDTLYGGEGDDSLDGEGGRDHLEGGAGNDTLTDIIGPPSDRLSGSSTQGEVLLGGGGNDIITFSHAAVANELLVDGGDDDDVISINRATGTFLGGAGNDQVTLVNCYGAKVTVDLGAGNDSIVLSLTNLMELASGLTLGAGKDVITPTDVGIHANILDFQAGEEGDRLDLSVAWGPDPFGTLLTIVQQGADAVIRALNNSSPLFILRNVNATELSQYNLGVPTSLFFNPAPRNFAGTPAADTYISADGNDNLSGQGDNDTLYGAGGNDVIDGGAGNDALYGGTGNDVLFGGTGIDRLEGGDGDDELWVDDANDVIVEGPEGGRDVVYSSVNYELAPGAGIEVLSTSQNSGTDPLALIGNENAQLIYGNAGANFLAGGGGPDTLIGLGGDDSYLITDGVEAVLEDSGGGRDVVYTTVDYTLAAGQEIEILSTSNAAGTAPLALVGNALGQEIYGNAGANFLQGGGGTDYLIGLGGDDSYFVIGANDHVFENAGGGRDVVYTTGNYTLEAGVEVEVLSTSSQSGTAALILVGNALGQEIYGNAGANFLQGGGGTDFLFGLAGNDSYVVSGTSEHVFEAAGGGRDVVYALADYTLEAGQEIEVLSTASTGATTAINLTGNGLANELYGNAGANVLNGGSGADYLQGFAGADSFAFTTALGGGNVDTIADFASGNDKILLDDAVFAAIGSPGALNANAFFAGTAAHDADDRIIYDSATGNLFYDADGNGGGAAVLFANLSTHPAVAASDFMVI